MNKPSDVDDGARVSVLGLEGEVYNFTWTVIPASLICKKIFLYNLNDQQNAKFRKMEPALMIYYIKLVCWKSCTYRS